jgi:DNA invertase Pin-like site-specific DNA recombinase
LPNMETAWSYTVVSSDQQSDTIVDQERWANDVARENGWAITRVFSGVSSGVAGTRKLLEDLLSELRRTPKTQRPKRVLCIRIDRLGRGDGLDAIAALSEIRNLGVVLHTRQDGDVRLERASDAILPAIRSIVGALENDVRSENWKAVHARRRAAGFHIGQVPFGITLVDGKVVPYEPEAAIVRELFAHAADSWGYTRLARWARERAPTKRMPDGTDRPYSWSPSTVKSILDGKTVRELLVTEDEWERAKAARAADFRSRAPRRWPWPLAGAVRCICGKLLRGHTAGVKGWEIRYMVCFSLDHGQPYPAHRADRLEEGFAAVLRRLAPSADILVPSREEARRKALITAQSEARRELEKLEQRRQRAWALADEGALTGPQLRTRLDEIDAARERSANELERATANIAAQAQTETSRRRLSQMVADLADAWPTLPTDTQQIVARAVASLPELNGLWVDPAQKHLLLPGIDLEKILGAKGEMHDDSITKEMRTNPNGP